MASPVRQPAAEVSNAPIDYALIPRGFHLEERCAQIVLSGAGSAAAPKTRQAVQLSGGARYSAMARWVLPVGGGRFISSWPVVSSGWQLERQKVKAYQFVRG